MGARFRQISTLDGVDEGTGPLDAGIVVPVGGLNLVYLQDGQHLLVGSDHPAKVAVTEITDVTSHDLIGFLADLRTNIAVVVAMTSSGAKRLFRVSGKLITGSHGTFINAMSRKTGNLEARLKVVLMRPKPMKVSLRQIQVYKDDAMKDMVLSSKIKFDPQAMLDHMNSVYGPQTNITFALARTDPVLIPTLVVGAEGPSRINAAHTAALTSAKDPDADLTIFFSLSAFDPPVRSHTPWLFGKNGYTNAKEGFCVVADSRLEYTVEHEAGHFLGALDDRGKYVKDYGHSSGYNIMNVDISSNGIIPFEMAKVFNKGFA
jgi:hypothetical protein